MSEDFSVWIRVSDFSLKCRTALLELNKKNIEKLRDRFRKEVGL